MTLAQPCRYVVSVENMRKRASAQKSPTSPVGRTPRGGQKVAVPREAPQQIRRDGQVDGIAEHPLDAVRHHDRDLPAGAGNGAREREGREHQRREGGNFRAEDAERDR